MESALIPLTNVGIQLATEPGTVNLCTTELPVVCGVVDLSDKEYDMIFRADVVTELHQIPVVSVVVAECVSTNDGANVIANVSNDQLLSESEDISSLMSNDDVTNAEFVNNSTRSKESVNDGTSKLMDEQHQNETDELLQHGFTRSIVP